MEKAAKNLTETGRERNIQIHLCKAVTPPLFTNLFRFDYTSLIFHRNSWSISIMFSSVTYLFVRRSDLNDNCIDRLTAWQFNYLMFDICVPVGQHSVMYNINISMFSILIILWLSSFRLLDYSRIKFHIIYDQWTFRQINVLTIEPLAHKDSDQLIFRAGNP